SHFVRVNFLADMRQLDFVRRAQDLLAKVVQTDADPAGVLEGHPGVTPMEEVEGRHGDAENLLNLGTFRGQKEVELLFQKLVKGTLVAETGGHELALPLPLEALVH